MRRLSMLWFTVGLVAQEAAPDPAEAVDDALLLERIEAGCAALHAAGQLVTCAELQRDVDGRRCELPLVAAAGAAQTPVVLRARLVASTWIVGQYSRCAECRAMHFSASTGFAVGSSGEIATCFHLLEADGQEVWLAVADWQGRVAAVREVLAADRAGDAIVVRTELAKTTPLPLRVDVAAGEAVWCLSNPDHMFASFSQGLVARHYVLRGPAPGSSAVEPSDETSHLPARPTGAARRWLQVTCEFAVGSSGAPVVDARGNVVGMAQSTATIAADDQGIDTQMVARTAVPAAAILALVRR